MMAAQETALRSSATRIEDWPLRLDTAIEVARHRPFAWGAHDCCSFAAGVVHALTGHDAFGRFTEAYGAYADERGAIRALGQAGGVSGIATAVLGDPIPVPLARRGDVLMVNLDGRASLAVCVGARCVAPGPVGLVWLPLRQATQAWRV